MNKSTNITKGVILALLTAAISGISIFYSKISLVKIDPLVLTASRNILVGFFFLVLVIATGKYKELARLTKKDSLKLLLIGLVGGSVPFYLFFTGLKLIGAQQGNMIHKTLFVWVAVLAFVFLKEKINYKLLLGGLLVLAGTFFFTPYHLTLGRGFQLVLIADLLWAAETILAKKVLNHVSAEITGLSRMLLGGAVLVTAVLAGGKGQTLLTLNTTQIAMIVTGAALLFFYVYTWFKALSHAPASVVTLLLTFSLVVGNLLSGAFAKAPLATIDWYSMMIISGGVILGAVSLGIFNKKTVANTSQVSHG